MIKPWEGVFMSIKYYEIRKEDSNIKTLKKAMFKSMKSYIILNQVIAAVLIFLISYYICRAFKMDKFIFIIFIALFCIELICALFIYNRIIYEGLYDLKDGKMKIEFSSKGITILKGEEIKFITWDGIDEIKIYEDYIVVETKMIGLRNFILLFNGFNEDKDNIISEIEMYKEVRWYVNEV